MPAPPCPAAWLWSACILWMHWVFVSKFAPANLQLRGSAITLETKAHIYTLYSSILFEYPIIPLLKFRSFALSSKPPFEQKPLLPLNLIIEQQYCPIFQFRSIYSFVFGFGLFVFLVHVFFVFFVCCLIVCSVLSIFSFWSFPLFILLPFYTRISDWQWKRKV